MQSKMCQVNGVNLHYLDWGGTGPPMVWLAGMRCTADIFIDIIPHFADQFRIVALTRRGHGQSDKPATGYYHPSVAKFRREVKNGRVVELACTHHNCFIHRQDEVVRAIEAFLADT